MTLPSFRRTATVITLAGAILATPAAAYAAPVQQAANVQQRINAHLAAHPGGRQINKNEISYGHGAFIMTFQTRQGPGVAATGACPRGWFCFYPRSDFGGVYGKLSSCGWQDLGWWNWRDKTQSAYYNLSRGSVIFYRDLNGRSEQIFALSTSARALPTVPFPKQADYVLRIC